MADVELTEEQKAKLQRFGSDTDSVVYPRAHGSAPTDWSEVVRDERDEIIGMAQVWNGTGTIDEVESITDVMVALNKAVEQNPDQPMAMTIAAVLREKFAPTRGRAAVRLYNDLFLDSPGMTEDEQKERVRKIAEQLCISFEVAWAAVEERKRNVERIMREIMPIQIPADGSILTNPNSQETEQ